MILPGIQKALRQIENLMHDLPKKYVLCNPLKNKSSRPEIIFERYHIGEDGEMIVTIEKEEAPLYFFIPRGYMFYI